MRIERVVGWIRRIMRVVALIIRNREGCGIDQENIEGFRINQ